MVTKSMWKLKIISKFICLINTSLKSSSCGSCLITQQRNTKFWWTFWLIHPLSDKIDLKQTLNDPDWNFSLSWIKRCDTWCWLINKIKLTAYRELIAAGDLQQPLSLLLTVINSVSWRRVEVRSAYCAEKKKNNSNGNHGNRINPKRVAERK